MQKKSLFRMCTVMALLFVSLVVNAQETLIKGNVISATEHERFFAFLETFML